MAKTKLYITYFDLKVYKNRHIIKNKNAVDTGNAELEDFLGNYISLKLKNNK